MLLVAHEHEAPVGPPDRGAPLDRACADHSRAGHRGDHRHGAEEGAGRDRRADLHVRPRRPAHRRGGHQGPARRLPLRPERELPHQRGLSRLQDPRLRLESGECRLRTVRGAGDRRGSPHPKGVLSGRAVRRRAGRDPARPAGDSLRQEHHGGTRQHRDQGPDGRVHGRCRCPGRVVRLSPHRDGHRRPADQGRGEFPNRRSARRAGRIPRKHHREGRLHGAREPCSGTSARRFE